VTGRVHADPDPSRPAGEAAHALLARLADVAEANVPGTRERLDDEFLHDLRVGVRRARSVLRELRAVFPAAELAHVRAELRWVQAATGPARDLDVQLAELGDLAAPLDARRRADLAPVRALLERRRDAAYAELRDALASQRFAAALAAWRALAPDPGAAAAARPVAEVAAERIRRVHRRMVRDGRAIGDASPDEALHDLRKRGKELRYLLELFGPLFAPEVVKPMVRALKDLQDVLGRFQDRVVQAELLEGAGRELARRRGGPEALMALGLVVEELRADQLRARGAFHARFDRFAAKGQRRLVAEAFA
jgi:CHAD domain-containing protein